MTFEAFKATVQAGIARGELKTTVELNELDLAIQYAIGREMELTGQKPLTVTTAQIAELIKKYCGEDVYNRAMLEASAPPESIPLQ